MIEDWWTNFIIIVQDTYYHLTLTKIFNLHNKVCSKNMYKFRQTLKNSLHWQISRIDNDSFKDDNK